MALETEGNPRSDPQPSRPLGACRPGGGEAELEAVLSHIPLHLDLVLLPGVLDGLEDAPGAVPPHLQAGHVASVPPLDQGRCLEGCDTDGKASL